MTRRAWIWLDCAAFALTLWWFWWDRDLPVKIRTPADAQIPAGHPGQEIKFSFLTDRDLSRDCAVYISRSIIDSQGAGRPYGMPQRISHQGLIDRAKLMGHGKLDLKVTIPPTDPSGRSYVLTDSAYTCYRNPSTFLVPIRVSYIWAFDVLPPEPKK